MTSNNICFIDFETTGVNVFRDEPMEIGAVLIDDDFEILKKFKSRIRIEKKVHLRKSAYMIHNITAQDLLNETTQKEVLRDFFNEFGTDYRFAGWNISFDVTFFRRLCNRNGFMTLYNQINHRHIDIQTLNFLANKLELLPAKLNSLSDLSHFFGLVRSEKHSAYEDSLLTFKVYKNLLKLFKENTKK